MTDYRKQDAERARALAIKQHHESRPPGKLDDYAPHDGYCLYCDGDLVLYYGTAKWASGISVTGCPKCHRSYCD